MGPTKYFLLGSVVLFGAIGFLGVQKRSPKEPLPETSLLQEISLPSPPPPPAPQRLTPPSPPSIASSPPRILPSPPPLSSSSASSSSSLPSSEDQIHRLFSLDSSKLPFVETISYTSRVPWLKGRPAWISDYASHYSTSRHFIARSLNKKPDYFSQKVGPGDKFNVFRKDKKIRFHLFIDLAEKKMRFYAIDEESNDKTLLKTYRVGLGRIDQGKKSGLLTPVGTYELGDKIAIYKPGAMGVFQEKKSEMIQIFGTRWIPFGKEIEGCSEPAKGFGIHGAPWVQNPATGTLVEDRETIGKYDSDGCIRLSQEDMEELFAIVITKPTTVELAKTPGVSQ